MTTRTVLRSNGRAYRVLLSQPPSYRRGADPVLAVDSVIHAVDKALRNSKAEVLDRSARRNPH